MADLNEAQKRAARIYGGGDYADVADMSVDELRAFLPHSGDTLFNFLMIELGDKEGCVDLETAIDRTRIAIDEIFAVQAELLK